MIAFDSRAIVELVSSYLDQTLDARSYGRFAAHLAGCEGCERYVAQLPSRRG